MKLSTTALIGATALAIVFGATTARADYNGGDPIKKGKMCFATTSSLGHGYWANCPKPAKVAKVSKKKKKMAKK